MNHRLLALTFLLSTAFLIAGDDQAISTDRPDFTESTDTVARGWLQIETGILLNRHSMQSGPSNYFGGPFPLIRVGLGRNIEFRWGSDGFGSESAFGADGKEHHTGMSDFETGIKARLFDERKYTPAFAVIGALSIPAGSTYFTSGHVDPLVGLCWSKSLPNEFDIGGNFNFKRLTASGITEKAFSVTSAKKLRRGYSAFAEIYRISPIEDDEAAHWIADAGVTKLLGRNAQLDLYIGHTLNARTPCWFVGVGFAIRIPSSGFVRFLAKR